MVASPFYSVTTIYHYDERRSQVEGVPLIYIELFCRLTVPITQFKLTFRGKYWAPKI